MSLTALANVVHYHSIKNAYVNGGSDWLIFVPYLEGYVVQP